MDSLVCLSIFLLIVSIMEADGTIDLYKVKIVSSESSFNSFSSIVITILICYSWFNCLFIIVITSYAAQKLASYVIYFMYHEEFCIFFYKIQYN